MKGGQGRRNGLAARGYRGQQGPGEQVKGGKTASAGRAVEAGRNGRLFGQVVQYRNDGGNWVWRAVQISLSVANGRGFWDTEGEGGGSIKQLNGGMGF